MEGIGLGQAALLCFTNNTDCCDHSNIEVGQWFFPDGSVIGDEAGAVEINRNSSVLGLNRRSNNITFPVGIFQCEIPDINETVQNIFIGIYPTGLGMLFSFSFDV